jgi:hypothetical protein
MGQRYQVLRKQKNLPSGELILGPKRPRMTHLKGDLTKGDCTIPDDSGTGYPPGSNPCYKKSGHHRCRKR